MGLCSQFFASRNAYIQERTHSHNDPGTIMVDVEKNTEWKNKSFRITARYQSDNQCRFSKSNQATRNRFGGSSSQ